MCDTIINLHLYSLCPYSSGNNNYKVRKYHNENIKKYTLLYPVKLGTMEKLHNLADGTRSETLINDH